MSSYNNSIKYHAIDQLILHAAFEKFCYFFDHLLDSQSEARSFDHVQLKLSFFDIYENLSQAVAHDNILLDAADKISQTRLNLREMTMRLSMSCFADQFIELFLAFILFMNRDLMTFTYHVARVDRLIMRQHQETKIALIVIQEISSSDTFEKRLMRKLMKMNVQKRRVNRRLMNDIAVLRLVVNKIYLEFVDQLRNFDHARNLILEIEYYIDQNRLNFE